MFTDFTLRGTWMTAMDSGAFHDFTFTPGVSMIVFCRDQEEIDRYWAGLSAEPEAEHSGWCIDRWGVSWQVVPHNIAELMADTATREKLLHMGRSIWPTCEASGLIMSSKRQLGGCGRKR